MHQALHVPEILLEIFEYATLPSYPNEPLRLSQQTAYALALTCKTFLPFALDRQWRVIDSVVPLLKTLPTEVWNIVNVPTQLRPAHATFLVSLFND
jgi:hypothetical protein